MAIGKVNGGILKSSIWQKHVTFSKRNASKDSLHRGRTRSLNGQLCSLAHICNNSNNLLGFVLNLPFIIWRYVNGSGYFADLADALEQAKEEIFITDWW